MVVFSQLTSKHKVPMVRIQHRAQPKTTKPTAIVQVWLALAWMVIISLVIFNIYSFARTPGRDSSAFLYVAKGILSGEVPYVDRWDHKGPLLYLFNAMGFILSGSSEIWWGLWGLQAAILLGTIHLARKIFEEAFGLASAIVAIIAYLLYYRIFAGVDNFSESYGLLFQFASIYIFYIYTKNGQLSNRNAFAIGCLGGLVFLMRANLIGLWLAIGLQWLFRKRIKNIGMAILGGIVTLSAFSLAFILVDGLPAFWDGAFAYNFAYSQSGFLDKIKATNFFASSFSTPMTLLLLLSYCLGLISCFKSRKRKSDRLMEMIVIAAPFEILLISIGGSQYQYEHYMLTSLPVITILIANLMNNITNYGTIKNLIYQRQKILFVSFLCLAAVLILGSFRQFREDFKGEFQKYIVYHSSSSWSEVCNRLDNEHRTLDIAWICLSDYINKNSRDRDKILAWGAESQIYLYSDRNSPSRFFYQYPLITENYTSKSMIDEFISDILAEKPLFIIDTMNGRLPPLDMSRRLSWNPPHGRYIDRSAEFQPLFDLVQENYSHVLSLGATGIKVYRRNLSVNENNLTTP